MTRELEHHPCEESPGAGVFQPGEQKVPQSPKSAFEGDLWEGWGQIFLADCVVTRKGGNGFQLKDDSDQSFFNNKGGKHWHSLPREMVNAPSLQMFKLWAMYSSCRCFYSLQLRVRLDDLWGPLQPKPFCDTDFWVWSQSSIGRGFPEQLCSPQP